MTSSARFWRKDREEAQASWARHQQWLLKIDAVHTSTAARRSEEAKRHRTGPRPATIERQEQQRMYGRWLPNSTCPKCFLLRCANGKCSGGCDD